jgi:hypothetical protein
MTINDPRDSDPRRSPDRPRPVSGGGGGIAAIVILVIIIIVVLTWWSGNRTNNTAGNPAPQATTNGSGSNASTAELNLNPQQKQTIMQSAQNEKGQQAPSSFQPAVGATVPQSMSLHQLPSNVSNEVPAAKGYEFTKLENNEILLVDPKDRRVAAIIPSPPGGSGAASELSLNPQQKRAIVQSVQNENGQQPLFGFQPTIGATVPQSMPLHQFPSSVTNEIPATKGYEFIKLENNEILLIDPKDRRVADILLSPPGTTGAAAPR